MPLWSLYALNTAALDLLLSNEDEIERGQLRCPMYLRALRVSQEYNVAVQVLLVFLNIVERL